MRTLHRSFVAALVAAGALGLSACDGILDVDLPGATTADALDNPAFAVLLTNSVQGEYESAYNGYVQNSAHLAGEIIGGFVEAGGAVWLQRNISEAAADYVSGAYAPMSVSRALADDVIRRLEKWTDAEVANRGRLLGRNYLYAGFNYLMFGESMCSAAFDLGPEVMPPAMFGLAKDRFTKALALATTAGDTETRNAANVGLARALFALGENPAALAAAQLVPAGFRKDVTRSSAADSRRNMIFININQNRRMSVDPHYWNLTFGGVRDPRVPVSNTGFRTTDGVTQLWTQTKYGSDSAPYRMASYTDAQFIIAEIQGGQSAVAVINALHTAAGLPAYAGGTATQIRDQLVDERRREYFLEGRRFGDLRKYGGFAEFTKGTHPFTPITFGGVECMPLPNVERFNNPTLSGKG
jgi:hypothetical protein